MNFVMIVVCIAFVMIMVRCRGLACRQSTQHHTHSIQCDTRHTALSTHTQQQHTQSCPVAPPPSNPRNLPGRTCFTTTTAASPFSLSAHLSRLPGNGMLNARVRLPPHQMFTGVCDTSDGTNTRLTVRSKANNANNEGTPHPLIILQTIHVLVSHDCVGVATGTALRIPAYHHLEL